MAGLELSSRSGLSESKGSARNVWVWRQSTELENVKSDGSGPAQCDEHDNEGHVDDSCGGRAARAEPAGANRNRRGREGDNDEHDDE